MDLVSAADTSLSTLSPYAWPYVSLNCLKLSRSITIRDRQPPERSFLASSFSKQMPISRLLKTCHRIALSQKPAVIIKKSILQRSADHSSDGFGQADVLLDRTGSLFPSC